MQSPTNPTIRDGFFLTPQIRSVSVDMQTHDRSENARADSGRSASVTASTTTAPQKLLPKLDAIKNLPESNAQNKRLLGLALILIGLALIPFTSGTSLVTLIPGLAALIPSTVGIGAGSGLCGIGLGLFVSDCVAPSNPGPVLVQNDRDQSDPDVEDNNTRSDTPSDDRTYFNQDYSTPMPLALDARLNPIKDLPQSVGQLQQIEDGDNDDSEPEIVLHWHNSPSTINTRNRSTTSSLTSANREELEKELALHNNLGQPDFNPDDINFESPVGRINEV